MKNTAIWITAAVVATALLTSCAKTSDVNEPAAQSARGVAFTPFVSNSLRAAEFGETQLKGTGFTVYAYGPNTEAYINGVNVKPEATGTLWAPQGGDIPWLGYELDFIAYANTGNYATPTIAKTGSTIALTTPAAVANQVDVLVARDKGNREDHAVSGVPLNFKHLLSQVEVKAKNSNQSYVVKVAGVKFGRINSSATFTFPENTKRASSLDNCYGTPATPKTFTAGSGKEVTLKSEPQSIMHETNGNFMFIPQTVTAWDRSSHFENGTDNNGNYLSVLVNITTKAGAAVYPLDKTKYAWAATGFSVTNGLKPGMKYVVTLDFSEGAGYEDPEKSTTVTDVSTGVTIDENPVGAGKDKPGRPILSNNPIKFTVAVEEWTPESLDLPMGK